MRFRKRFKLAPGVKFNINKKSLGLTLGARGANLTYNTKGQRTASVGLPGTGLWYRDTKKVGSSRTGAEYNKPMPNADDISREALEAEAWLNAHTQDRDAMQEWMSQMYEWAGADLARRAQVREMVLARVRQWVQSAVDMGQRNHYVQCYAESLSREVDFEALADEAQRQADAQLAPSPPKQELPPLPPLPSSAEGVVPSEFELPPLPPLTPALPPQTPARGFFSGFRAPAVTARDGTGPIMRCSCRARGWRVICVGPLPYSLAA